LLLLAFSLALYLLQEGVESRRLDDHLRQRAMALAASCEWESELGRVEVESFTEVKGPLDPLIALDVWTLPERKLLRQSIIDRFDADLPADLPKAGFDTFATERNREGHEFRIYYLVRHKPPQDAVGADPAEPEFTVLARAASRLEPLQSRLRSLLAVLGIASAGMVLLVLLFAHFLAERFVRPIEALANAASQVRLGSRTPMPRRGCRDEIESLACILDETFASLEESLERQRAFTANAAHELRNPLSIIRSAAEVALRRERTSAEYHSFLKDVLSTAERMTQTVEGLLLLARLDAGVESPAAESVSLSALALETQQSLSSQDERARVSVTTDGEARVDGDARLLRLLIDNLVRNALQYSNPGAPVSVLAASASGFVRLTVRDEGPGIPAELRPHIFNRFTRFDPDRRNAQGAGLGLALVQQIAKAHGATCRLVDGGRGTSVEVNFPLANQDRSPIHSAPSA